MKIGLITYNNPHRKTYDIACLMKTFGFDATILLTDYYTRQPRRPLIQHRPDNNTVSPGLIAAAFGWDLRKFESARDEFDLLIIGGCNVLPGLVALNSHPGFLPYVRGLDALKWSIYHSLPIGVTVHLTTDEPDQGPIIARKFIPLYFEDTFHSLAYRVYKYEIETLVESIGDKFIEPNVEKTGFEDVVHARMPQYKERIMLERFESIRKNAKSMYEI